MRRLVAILIAGCVSPPAKPEACREDISLAYARESLAFVTKQTTEFGDFARNSTRDGADEDWPRWMRYRVALDAHLRARTITRCVDDHWPSNVARCFGDAGTYDEMASCARALPHDQCLALEEATRYTDHDPGGRCGEPPHRYF